MKRKLFFVIFAGLFLASGRIVGQQPEDASKTETPAPSSEAEAAPADGAAATTAAEPAAEPAPASEPAPVAAAPAVTTEVEKDKEPAAPSPSGPEISIAQIIKQLKALREKLEISEKRMDQIVSVVLSSTETKGSRLALTYQSEMSADFKLVQATVALDGAPIYNKTDDEGLLKDPQMEIYDGAVLPGKHTLNVSLIFRGIGYGIMAYLSKYKFTVRSNYSFEVKTGKGIDLKVVSFEKGDVNTKLEDRPAVKYVEKKIESE